MKKNKLSKKETFKKKTKNKEQVVTYPSYTDNGSYIVHDQYIRVTDK